jgi:hypothetical protein
MTSMRENALSVLRVMVQELKLGIMQPINHQQILDILGLDLESFNQARQYLSQQGYIRESPSGAYDISIRLTANGLDFLEEKMAARLPLSLRDERLLYYCVEHLRHANDWFSRDQLIRELGLTVEQVFTGMERLELHDLVRSEGTGLWSVTKEGREAVRTNFQRIAPTSTQFTFTAPVYGNVVNSNTGTVSSSYVFNELEAEIERRGEDVEELKEMVHEINRLLQEGDALPRGALARFSTLMERHSWITGSIAQFLLQYAFVLSQVNPA